MSSADYGTTVDVRISDEHAAYSDDGDDEHDDKYARRHRCCVRYGNTYVLCATSERYGYFPTTCHVGPNWPCMLITYCIAIGPLFLFFLYVFVYCWSKRIDGMPGRHDDASNYDLALGFQIALVLSVVATTCSFTMVACSDPGVVFESYKATPAPLDVVVGDAESGGPGVICAQCQIRRPHDASHCSDCGVCVSQLDHHCPWTGKCVGKRTLRWFYVFLTCISVHVVLIGVGAAATYFMH